MGLLQHDPSARVLAFARPIPAAATQDAVLVQKLRDWIALSDAYAVIEDRKEDLFEAAYDRFPVPMDIRVDPANTHVRQLTGDLEREDAKDAHLLDICLQYDFSPKTIERTRQNLESERAEIRLKIAKIAQHQSDIAGELARNGHDALQIECVRASDDMGALERDIAKTPAAGPVGMLVKLVLANQWEGFIPEGSEDGDHDRRLITGVVRDLERLSGITIAQLLGQ